MTDSAGTRAWRRLGVLAAVCLVVALGNLRVRESVAAASPGPLVDGRQSPVAVDTMTAAFDSGESAGFGEDEDGPPDVADTHDANDEARLIPAVYARDPDVRFVYFRQVSKWM